MSQGRLKEEKYKPLAKVLNLIGDGISKDIKLVINGL